jgi:hypothetical protein
VEKFTIVLAWAEDTFVHDGMPYQADLGHAPRMVPCRKTSAAVWLNAGGAADLAKANAYAAADKDKQVYVYTFPCAEKDPLGRARKQVLANQGVSTFLK